MTVYRITTDEDLTVRVLSPHENGFTVTEAVAAFVKLKELEHLTLDEPVWTYPTEPEALSAGDVATPANMIAFGTYPTPEAAVRAIIRWWIDNEMERVR